MGKILVEMPVDGLKIGQYVSQLDRPWSETPFLFQGFEIETHEDIAQLRSLCKVVQLEVTDVEAEALKTTARAPPDPLSDLSQVLANRAGAVANQDPVPLKTELVEAKRIFAVTRQAVTDVFNRIRRGGAPDVAMLDPVMDAMIDSLFRNRDALSWLACMKRKDDYLYNHSLSCSVWALSFGRHLGLDKETLKVIGIGAMLLDIGKTKLPDILLKSSNPPSDRDWKQLRAHVENGLELLRSEPKVDHRIGQMIASHHERMDGTGYPHALRGDEIPLPGRIAGIVDCYDAMTSDRNYAKGKSTYQAVLELKKLGGTWFQSELIELFIQAVGVFPTGTLVELNTREIGVVVAQNRFRRLRPQVMMILDADRKLREEFVVIDLQMREDSSRSDEPPLWIAQGLEPGAYGIDPTEYFL